MRMDVCVYVWSSIAIDAPFPIATMLSVAADGIDVVNIVVVFFGFLHRYCRYRGRAAAYKTRSANILA